jgi:hypothetical protein
MTKQELDQAYADGRLNQENYRLAIQKIGAPPEIGEAQKTVDSAMKSLVQASGQADPVQKRYQELLASNQIQSPEKPIQEIDQLAVQTLEQEKQQAELKKKADLDLQNEELAKQQAEQKKIDELNKKKQSLGLEINQQTQNRQPTQDGQKPRELLINPAAQQQAGMVSDTTPKTSTPEIPQVGLGQMQSAYADVGRIENEFNAKIKQVQIDDQRQQESNMKAQEIIKNSLNRADELNKDFENGSQIDPGRYWGKADTWSKIGAVLSASFSGYAQAYTGGRNAGLDMIMDLTNKDIEAQVKNASLAQAKAQSAMNMYERYRQTFKDDQAAYEATKLSSLNLIKAKYDMAQGKFKNAADMAKLNAEIQTSSAALQNKLLENGSSIALAIDYARNPRAKFDNELNKDPARLAAMIKDKKVEAININGSPFVSENPEVQKNLRSLYTTTNQINGILEKMKVVQQGGVTDQVAKDAFDALSAQLTPLTTKKYGLGSLDEGLQNLVKKITSGISYNAIRSDPQKAIGSFQRNVNDEFETFANSMFSGNEQYISELGTNPELQARAKKR